MTKHVTESVRSNAIRITLNARPEIDPDCTKPLRIENVTIDRLPDRYSQREHDLNGDIKPVPAYHNEPESVAVAWETFVRDKFQKICVSVLVGPGRSDIKAHELIAMPNHWRVMWIDNRDRIHHVGDFLHRLSAMAVVKTLDSADRCPLVVSPFMMPDYEWNSDFVVESSELNEAIRRALR